MIGHLKIFKNFWKDKKVGAITSTSPICVRKVCNKIDYDLDNVVVEYGPGTGVFSDYLLEHLTPDSKLILIETNENLVKELKKKYKKEKRVHIFQESAEKVKKVLEEAGENQSDYVISGIPFSFFSKKVKSKIIKATRNILSKRGKFLIYQYSPHLTNYLRYYFDEVSIEFSIWNIPPMTIFEAQKAKPEEEGVSVEEEKIKTGS